jgi:transglutaminase-like putative cysteine protease
MLLELVHETDLNYSDLISESVMELRVTPLQEEGQHRLSFDLEVGPPTGVTSYFDWQGNTVHSFAINRFHNRIRIVATSVVETDRPATNLLSLTDTWPLDASQDHELYDFTHFDGPVVDDPRLGELAEMLRVKRGEPIGRIANRLLDLMTDHFNYQKGITSASSTIAECLEHRSGVCQDFTHVSIGVLRKLGIPARYVSGLAHSDSDRDIRGASQTHAWCELLCPSVGWVGIDPTNHCVVDDNFVKVAVGRHFSDVAPNRGVYKGKATETIDVRVHSHRLEEIPPELAGERMGAIDIPAFPAGSKRQMDYARAQFASQQQQQQAILKSVALSADNHGEDAYARSTDLPESALPQDAVRARRGPRQGREVSVLPDDAARAGVEKAGADGAEDESRVSAIPPRSK